MGNRAVIAAEGASGTDTAMYLHWNGGPESVRAFLRVAQDLGVRGPVNDSAYFFARLAQVVGNFFGGTCSVGVGPLDSLDTDNGDNGTYYVNDAADIVRREHARGDGRDANYEFAVYRDALKKNYAVFNTECHKLPARAVLIKRAAKALRIDLKRPCAECGYYNGLHAYGCKAKTDKVQS